MTFTTLLGLILGSLLFIVGLMVIIFRKKMRDFIGDLQRTTFGKLGEAVDNATSTWMTALVGAGFMGSAIYLVAYTYGR